MSDWFRDFHRVLGGAEASADLQLIPAGTASMDEMLKHVRYQFTSKTREACEDTFPKAIARMGQETWEELWMNFQRSRPASPRSLDEYPRVLLEFVSATDAPHALKELMRFEWAIETHSWNYRRLQKSELPALELTDALRIELAELDIQRFSAPVLALYEGYEVFSDHESQTLVLWFTEEGIRFRRLDDWEVAVLEKLHLGIGEALEFAPDDAALVTEFFQWLGRSGLIRRLF